MNSRSVWFSWTAPAAGPVQMDVCDYERVSGPGNRALIVYTGNTLGTLVALAPGSGNCEVSFVAAAGTTYRIAYSGNISGEMNFTLRLKSAPPPPNDNFANAVVVGPNLPVLVAGSNEFATAQAGEPEHTGSGFPAARSVWYDWTPAASGRVSPSRPAARTTALVSAYTPESP